MTTLQTRLAQADKPMRELLEEVFWLVFPAPAHAHMGEDVPAMEAHTAIWLRFKHMLDAEAWTSAVEMLVPDGCLHMARTVWEDAIKPTERAVGYASIDRFFRDGDGLMWRENFLGLAATPALALAIAGLKARGL